LKSHKALNLIDFVILPHYGKEKYLDRYQKIKENYKDKGYEMKNLTDQQAIIVEDNKYRIVETD
jgi:dipeptidase E